MGSTYLVGGALSQRLLERTIGERDERIAALEAEIADLRRAVRGAAALLHVAAGGGDG